MFILMETFAVCQLTRKLETMNVPTKLHCSVYYVEMPAHLPNIITTKPCSSQVIPPNHTITLPETYHVKGRKPQTEQIKIGREITN